MKKLSQLMLIFSSISMLLFSACGSGDQSQANQAEEVSAKQVDPVTVFDNPYVEVVKVTLAPGEMLAAHEGEARLIYSMTDYSIDWTEKGQDQGEKTWKKGAIHVHDAGEHAAVNNGSTTAEWVAFVRKTENLPDCGENTLDKDATTVAGDFVNLLFDNEDFRVTEVKLPPSGQLPWHSGVNRIIYSLSEYTVRYQSDDEATTDKSFKEGDAHWHEACMHSLENIGESEAVFLVVSFKEK